MARPKKEGVKVSYVLEKQVAEALDKFCDETGRSKTKVIELAVKEFIENHKGVCKVLIIILVVYLGTSIYEGLH